MESGVFVKYYMDLPFDRSEILRYAGVRRGDQSSADGQVAGLLERCVALVAPVVSPKVCWMTLPVSLRGDVADLGAFSVRSADFARCVSGADRLVLFAATVGVAIYSDVDMIASLCALMARGALISMLCVILILPAMFMLFDKVIGVTTIGFRPKKEKK